MHMKLLDELKRRNIFRVAAAYLVSAWLVIQVTNEVSPALGRPDWISTLVGWLGVAWSFWGASLVMVGVWLLFFVLQRYLVGGLAAGGVKG